MTLKPEDYLQFLNIQHDLLYFVGLKTNLLPSDLSMEKFQEMGMIEKFECRQKLYENNKLINQYLKEKGLEVSEVNKIIIKGFKKRVSGEFIIFKTLSHYAVFNSMQDNKFYAVKALGDPFTKFFPQFPVIVNAILLPFKGQIIYDGFLQSRNIYIGSNMRGSINEEYKRAKKNKMLIMSLE